MITLDTPRHTLEHPRPTLPGAPSAYRSPGLTLARKRRAGTPIDLIEALGPTPTGNLADPPVLRRD
jgi:hypothetical protein